MKIKWFKMKSTSWLFLLDCVLVLFVLAVMFDAVRRLSLLVWILTGIYALLLGGVIHIVGQSLLLKKKLMNVAWGIYYILLVLSAFAPVVCHVIYLLWRI